MTGYEDRPLATAWQNDMLSHLVVKLLIRETGAPGPYSRVVY